jgi:mannose-1-phosphate guanylyltransferase/phosphomannomutase
MTKYDNRSMKGNLSMRSKARLTITLANDLLDQLDQTVDGKIVRNRSHAIEVLLEESLRPKVTTAVILAGGRQPANTPPPLLPVGQKPLLSNTLDLLKRHGIKLVFILGGHSPNQLRDGLGKANHHGMVLQYIYEAKPLGTAGAVLAIAGELSNEPFLVIHGDVLTNINLSDMITFHKRANTLATIAVKPREAERKYGKVMIQGNRITEFLETDKSEGMSIVNAGVYVIHPHALRLVDRKPPTFFERDLFPRLAGIGELSAFMFQGIWFDISQKESYQQALTRWG